MILLFVQIGRGLRAGGGANPKHKDDAPGIEPQPLNFNGKNSAAGCHSQQIKGVSAGA
jgi:hypothetical protein